MKHEGFTPGPWKTEDSRTIQTPSGTFFLSYFTEKGTGKPSFGNFCELDANARLIADAPALLAERDMLREALEAMMYQFDTDEEDYDCIVLARAALAASKG